MRQHRWVQVRLLQAGSNNRLPLARLPSIIPVSAMVSKWLLIIIWPRNQICLLTITFRRFLDVLALWIRVYLFIITVMCPWPWPWMLGMSLYLTQVASDKNSPEFNVSAGCRTAQSLQTQRGNVTWSNDALQMAMTGLMISLDYLIFRVGAGCNRWWFRWWFQENLRDLVCCDWLKLRQQLDRQFSDEMMRTLMSDFAHFSSQNIVKYRQRSDNWKCERVVASSSAALTTVPWSCHDRRR